jgi:hypothetical protein
VITAATADFADKRDSQCIEKICNQTLENLSDNHLELGELLADTGYCSGEALKYLDEKNINSWMPNFGQFTAERNGFIYNKELNQYECQRGNRATLPFKSTRTDKTNNYTRHNFRSSESSCKTCQFVKECCGEKTKFKRIEHSQHYDLYQQNHKKRLENQKYAKRMSKLRSSTVEPVLGTLINHLGMKKVNTRGIAQAEKHVLMASLCYNLKKLLKFKPKMFDFAKKALPKVKEIAKNLCFDFLPFHNLFCSKLRPRFSVKKAF